MLADHHLAFTKCQTISLPEKDCFWVPGTSGTPHPYGIHHHMMDYLSFSSPSLCRGGFSLPAETKVSATEELEPIYSCVGEASASPAEAELPLRDNSINWIIRVRYWYRKIILHHLGGFP